jgi:hypothetical protein
MPPALVAECVHEVCSFNPVPTRYDGFFASAGEGFFAHHRSNT